MFLIEHLIWIYLELWLLVVGIFWLVVGAGGWLWVAVGCGGEWMVVDIFWLVVDGGII